MAILTISRELGSGGREIGQAIAQDLGYDFVDKAKILDDLQGMGKNWEKWGESMDEHCPTIWEKYDWSFRGFGALIQSTILNYAMKDSVVLIGRGANFILEGIPFADRIHVMAPIEDCVARIMVRESVDRETALWLKEKTDRDRSSFIYSLYGKRWGDPEEYEEVVNTAEQSIDDTTAKIKEILKQKDRQSNEPGWKELEMRAAAAKVKAGILTDPSIFIPTLDIFYDGKSIVVKGIIHNPKEHKKIEKKTAPLAGNYPLRYELHYRG
jgi:cytidylate kinase